MKGVCSMIKTKKKTKVKQLKLITVLFALILFLVPAGNTTQAANNSTFSDMPGSHWAYGRVMGLQEMGIINGYRDGRFGTRDSLSRGQASTLIVKGAGINYRGKRANFKDVSRNNEFSSFIAGLVDVGAVNGYRDGRFGPNDKITRGQIAAIVVRAFDLKEGPHRTNFPDTSNNEFRKYIHILASNGIVGGYADGKYGPDNPVTRAEFSVILSKSMAASGKNVVVVTPPPQPRGRIKGNISTSGEKIYHVPGGAYYDDTIIDESKGERWFRTEAEARAAGWRKSQR